jgi:N-acetylglutamate synthase-like GNAT family acetyltransferase
VALTIRDARVEDADAIASLLDQLGYPTGAGAVESRLERVRIVGDRVVVAELDGRVVGVAQLHVSPTLALERPAAKIDGIVVDESCRGRGVGRALVAEMEAEARARGCPLLYLTTATRRAEAHEFYRRVGLEETGKRFGKSLETSTE